MGTDFKGRNIGLIQDCSSFKEKTLERGKQEGIDRKLQVLMDVRDKPERNFWSSLSSGVRLIIHGFAQAVSNKYK